jgi:methyl-accepting chemotaxis protein
VALFAMTQWDGSLLDKAVPIGIAFVFALSLGFSLFMCEWFLGKTYWYENILDHIPIPISVTDMHRNTTFINRPVEHFLGVKRASSIGVPCCDVWKAGLCKTGHCGIECLQKGVLSTTFAQAGMDFKVDTNYLHDKRHKRIGHIEVVQDLTEIFKKQKAEAALVQDIGTISRTFADTSRQIATGSQGLAETTTDQSTTVAQLSSSVFDINATTQESADKAHKADGLAKTIKTNAEKGNQQMHEMIQAVKEINDASASISKVIKTIDDIAFQTNILALNAAVEAARAGQHGKGFAVVAEEVRNLASKSAEAAKETSSLIQNSAEKAKLGSRIAGETASSLEEIVIGINESSQLIFDIAKLSERQAQGISSISSGIEHVSNTIQQISATAQESAASSMEMSSQAAHLEHLLQNFGSGEAS